jgi:hypothetical protein
MGNFWMFRKLVALCYLRVLTFSLLSSYNQPFENHVAIITFLLNNYVRVVHQHRSQDGVVLAAERTLMEYILAKSSQRMKDRLSNRASQNLLKALTLIDAKECENAAYPNAVPLSTTQISRDNKFLRLLASKVIQAYLASLGVHAEALLEAAGKAEGCIVTFYNKRTSSEIHKLLIASLADILTTVTKISDMKGGFTEEHARLVARVSLSCTLLRLFVHSSAAPAHFTRLSLLLADQVHQLEAPAKALKPRPISVKPSVSSKVPTPSSTTSSLLSRISSSKPMLPDEQPDALDDIDEEYEGGLSDHEDEDNPPITLSDIDREVDWVPIVKQYMRWMRRQISHTESVKTLCRMARRWIGLPNPPTISIKVLATDHPGTSMKPWQDVVRSVWSTSNEPGDKAWTPQEVVDRLKEMGIYRSSLTPSFQGTLHCEACLASLLHLGLLRTIDAVRMHPLFDTKS